jgi:hypothetical protein
MHCQAIPSNLDRVKQASIDSTDFSRLIDPMTHNAVMRDNRPCATSLPETPFVPKERTGGDISGEPTR